MSNSPLRTQTSHTGPKLVARHVKEALGPEDGYFKVSGDGPFWPALELTIEQARAVAVAFWNWHVAQHDEKAVDP